MQESRVEIRGIFPTPIYSYKMNRSFNSSELKFLEKIQSAVQKLQFTGTTLRQKQFAPELDFLQQLNWSYKILL